MISIQEAQRRVIANSERLPETTIPVNGALGYTLYRDIQSPIDLPPFDSSAMDGYAICTQETSSNNFEIIGEIQAGSSEYIELRNGQAVRIFTGAMVPSSATTIIMQESTTVQGNLLTINKPIELNKNIRKAGEQIRKGEQALKAGVELTAAGIGFLASMGIQEVSVYRKPKIGLLVTGNELVSAGAILSRGQIYESNSATLLAACHESGFEVKMTEKASDSLEETKQKLNDLILACDLVMVSGGISVGDYDFVGSALKQLEVEEIFYKIKQKPGKPLFFGKKRQKCCFALPGNPASALSCFYHYVLPAMKYMSGSEKCFLEEQERTCNNAFVIKGNRAQFLKAYATESHVTILEGQGSGMLHSFAIANAMVLRNEEDGDVAIGDKVRVYLLP